MTPNKNVGPKALQIAGKIDACFFVLTGVMFTLADVLVFLNDAFVVKAFFLLREM